MVPEGLEMVNSGFEVHLVRLDPADDGETKKSRPCLVVSPDEMNQYIGTVMVAPMTTKGMGYPTRVPVEFQAKSGEVVLDRVRTVDKSRLVKRLGKIGDANTVKVMKVLAEMFGP